LVIKVYGSLTSQVIFPDMGIEPISENKGCSISRGSSKNQFY